MIPMASISTYVHPDLKRRLTLAAIRNNRSLSEEVRYRLGKSWFVDVEEAIAGLDRALKRGGSVHD